MTIQFKYSATEIRPNRGGFPNSAPRHSGTNNIYENPSFARYLAVAYGK